MLCIHLLLTPDQRQKVLAEGSIIDFGGVKSLNPRSQRTKRTQVPGYRKYEEFLRTM